MSGGILDVAVDIRIGSPTFGQSEIVHLTVENRKMLFIPEFYQKHEEFGALDLNKIFDSKNPIYIEYCSGNGQWIIEQAERHPEINWIGVEKQFRRARQIYAKGQNRNLSNLLIVSGEALTFSRYYLAEAVADQSFVNFPDPWPKDRHAKHRLITPTFAAELTRVLKPNAKSLFVTDHEIYAQQMIEVMQAEKRFAPCAPAPYFVTDWKGYGSSFFGSLWKNLGRTIHYIEYKNGC